MPISDSNTATSSGMIPMGGFNFGGMNLGQIPGYQSTGMSSQQLQNLPVGFSSIQNLLSQQPQSMTNSLMPGLMQILGLQTGAMGGMFGNQTSQMESGAQSDAMKRGMTGSSIEASGMLSARQAGMANYNQFLGQQLGTLGNAYQGSVGADVNAQNMQYQNLAQALGQQMQSQLAQQQFQQMMEQQRNLAGDANRMGLWGAGIGALGSGATALAMHSDSRLKKNVEVLGDFKGLPVYAFDYIDDDKIELPRGRQIGFMAHEVAKKYPDSVFVDRGYLCIDHASLNRSLGVA